MAQPEPRHLWGSGDSAVPRYQDVITMHECRSAEQLASVIDALLPVELRPMSTKSTFCRGSASRRLQNVDFVGGLGPSAPGLSCPYLSRKLVNRGFSTQSGRMGGTFDPIHNGHLVAASEIADLFELDEVVFVPTGQPWQKHHRHVTAAEDRDPMTVIATASNPRFSVSRVDIDRGGPTYTKDTLRHLRALNQDADLYFITGADALASILSWQNWEEMFSIAKFVGVSRPGYELDGPAHQGGNGRVASRGTQSRGGARAGDLIDRLP